MNECNFTCFLTEQRPFTLRVAIRKNGKRNKGKINKRPYDQNSTLTVNFSGVYH